MQITSGIRKNADRDFVDKLFKKDSERYNQGKA